MLGWVRTILPSRFQFKFEKEAPFCVPGASIRSVATLPGDGINTLTHTQSTSSFGNYLFYENDVPKNETGANLVNLFGYVMSSLSS